jgi:C-terminal processing protease CtpA/Prc
MRRPFRALLKLILTISMVLVICILNAGAFRQSSLVRLDTVQQGPVNLDFEQGDIGQLPVGWASPTRSLGYEAKLIEEGSRTGKKCVLLYSDPDASSSNQRFGNVMQAIDAKPYRGKRIRFKGSVRMEGSDGKARAQLWFRVDLKENKRGFFDDMGDRPITSGEWKDYEIVGDIDEEAAVINIGMILLGKGKAWLDNTSIENLGTVVVLKEPPRALDARGLENLRAFTRLLGYIRHFHPSDEAAAADWDLIAVEGMRTIESAKSPEDLAKKLEELFRPLAPTVRVFLTGEKPPAIQELSSPPNLSSLKIVSWRHKGFGSKVITQHNPYSSERMRKDLPEGIPAAKAIGADRLFTTDLGGGVSAVVPLELFADENGTLPHASKKTEYEKTSLVKYNGNDRTTRLADVALAWNILQHFYPYFDVVKTDWQMALKQALLSAATDQDEKAFLRTLQRMIAELKDGHGNVFHPSISGFHSIPMIWDWVEEKLVITHVAANGAEGLQPGDIVLSVNGKPSNESLAEEEAFISSATKQWCRYKALEELRKGNKDSEVKLEVQTLSGERKAITLRRSLVVNEISEPRPAKISEVKQGIFYVNIDRINDEDFKSALPQLEKAKGIVFDLRGYPNNVSPLIIHHLIDKPVNSARWNVPVITAPDQKAISEYDTSGRWTLEPKEPRLKAKIAFITDGRAISYAESYMGIIEAYKLAEIVGEPTAGTNGDINPFTLPGGYKVIWTGMKVLKHDGSQHHGIGILPTVPVSRTLKGVTEKRDEQLEAAIAVVSH